MASSQLTCRTCSNQFSGKYCNQCGEKYYTERDRKISHLLEEAFHFITHFEGKFFKTIRTIFTRPGKLSADYCSGIRKPYFKPISLFLLLVILYLMFPLFEGLNMYLQYHFEMSAYGDYAQRKSNEVMAAKGLTLQELGEIFHRKGEKTSKFLLFIIIPFMALWSWMLSFKKRKYYFDQFVFSTELSSFFLLAGFLIFPFLIFLYAAISGDKVKIREDYIGYTIVTVQYIYVLLASRRFFDYPWWRALLYAVFYTLMFVFFVQVVYKFILFYVTIHLI